MTDDFEVSDPIVVDHRALQPDTLRRLVEEFVTRDGTDYGEIETSLDRRVAQVIAQLDQSDAVVVFDPASESATIVRAGDAPRES